MAQLVHQISQQIWCTIMLLYRLYICWIQICNCCIHTCIYVCSLTSICMLAQIQYLHWQFISLLQFVFLLYICISDESDVSVYVRLLHACGHCYNRLAMWCKLTAFTLQNLSGYVHILMIGMVWNFQRGGPDISSILSSFCWPWTTYSTTEWLTGELHWLNGRFSGVLQLWSRSGSRREDDSAVHWEQMESKPCRFVLHSGYVW